MKYFSMDIFHNGEMFLEAAKRCCEPQPDEATGQSDTLLFPAEHCAVIACEMFLKAVSATPCGVYTDRVTIVTWRGEHGHISEDLIESQLSTKIGQKVRVHLTDADMAEIAGLCDRFAQSRYPYERSTTRPEADKAIAVAEKLYNAIKEAMQPDADGDIQLA